MKKLIAKIYEVEATGAFSCGGCCFYSDGKCSIVEAELECNNGTMFSIEVEECQ